MGLENSDYIAELDPNNPAGSDAKSFGDDHLRAIKRSTQGSFPAFVGTQASPKSVSLTEDQINDAALKSEVATISAAWTFQDAVDFEAPVDFAAGMTVPGVGIALANLVPITMANNAGDPKQVMRVSNLDTLTVGDDTLNFTHRALAQHTFFVDNINVMTVSDRDNGAMAILPRGALPFRLAGFRNPYYEGAGSVDETATQEWEGTVRAFTPTDSLRVITLPVLEQGTTFRLMNSGVNQTLNIEASGVTIRFYDGSGERKTGNVTLNGGSVMEVYYVSTTTIYVFGNGITVA